MPSESRTFAFFTQLLNTHVLWNLGKLITSLQMCCYNHFEVIGLWVIFCISSYPGGKWWVWKTFFSHSSIREDRKIGQNEVVLLNQGWSCKDLVMVPIWVIGLGQVSVLDLWDSQNGIVLIFVQGDRGPNLMATFQLAPLLGPEQLPAQPMPVLLPAQIYACARWVWLLHEWCRVAVGWRCWTNAAASISPMHQC